MGTIFHTIKAFLYENFLTDDPNDYVARVDSERSLSVHDICETAVSRGGADTSSDKMEHNVNLFFKEMSYQMCDGYTVNTGYFTAGVHISGVFNSPDETFNSEKHSSEFLFNQGPLLRAEFPSIKVEIQGVAKVGCYIGDVTDIKTNSVNQMLTPERNLRIRGSKIKLAGSNPAVGVYFISQANGNSTKVESLEIVNNKPSEVLVVIPALSAGDYTIEIRTQYAGSALLKEPRTASLNKTLTVL